MHLPDSATVMALFGAEYGVKLGSQLFIKHIVESGLAAKGNSLQEGDLILKVGGPRGAEHSLGVSSAPLWRACPWLVSLQDAATAMLGAVLSVSTPYPSPPAVPGTLQGLSGPSSLLPGLMACPAVTVGSCPPYCPYSGPRLCVSMSPLDDCHRCLSDKTML